VGGGTRGEGVKLVVGGPKKSSPPSLPHINSTTHIEDGVEEHEVEGAPDLDVVDGPARDPERRREEDEEVEREEVLFSPREGAHHSEGPRNEPEEVDEVQPREERGPHDEEEARVGARVALDCRVGVLCPVKERVLGLLDENPAVDGDGKEPVDEDGGQLRAVEAARAGDGLAGGVRLDEAPLDEPVGEEDRDEGELPPNAEVGNDPPVPLGVVAHPQEGLVEHDQAHEEDEEPVHALLPLPRQGRGGARDAEEVAPASAVEPCVDEEDDEDDDGENHVGRLEAQLEHGEVGRLVPDVEGHRGERAGIELLDRGPVEVGRERDAHKVALEGNAVGAEEDDGVARVRARRAPDVARRVARVD
jgi:hypothetical protein